MAPLTGLLFFQPAHFIVVSNLIDDHLLFGASFWTLQKGKADSIGTVAQGRNKTGTQTGRPVRRIRILVLDLPSQDAQILLEETTSPLTSFGTFERRRITRLIS